MLHFRRTIVALAAAASIAIVTVTAAPAATDLTSDPSSSAAPIEILGSSQPPAGGDATPRTIDEALSFSNHASAPATSIDFTWLFVDANGSIIGEQHTSTRGRFGPNVAIARDAAASAHVTGYATGASLYIGDEDTNQYEPIEHVFVAVDNATFADGTAWHGKTRQSSALPPQMTYDATAAAAHVRITRIQTTRAQSVYDRVDTRLSFANDSTKRIAAIEFGYTCYDADGELILHQTAIARGAYSHGAISTFNPSTRITFKGVVARGGSVWIGWGDHAQYVAKIVAGIDAIQYADGTTWTANS